MALAELRVMPDLKAVFAATGSNRFLRLGLFLGIATSRDMAALLTHEAEESVLTGEELEMVWQQWVELDVKAAVAWNAGDSNVWAAWARIDPRTALTAAGENAVRLGQVIRSIGAKDPGWAERLLARYPQVDGATGWAGAVGELSGADPAAAATLAMAKGTPWQKQVAAWALREPAAALAWAREVPQTALQQQAVAEVLRNWTRVDPGAALGEAVRLAPGRTGSKLIAEAVTALARVDEAAARGSVEKLPPGLHRQAGIAALAEGLAANNPLAALETLRSLSWKDYYAQERPRAVWKGGNRGSITRLDYNGRDSEESASKALRLVTGSHPGETMNLLASQQAGDESVEEAFGESFHQWLSADPETASTWLRVQPPGAARETGIKQTLQLLLADGPTNDYPAAFKWAAVAEEKDRHHLVERVLREWGQADYEAAAAAGARHGVPVDPPRPKSGPGNSTDPLHNDP